jgi:hypothetical protein
MNEKVALLFVAHSGHVLAAITRAADPEGKLDAKDLAGAGLLVRGFDDISPPHAITERFEVSPADLGVLITDFTPDLLLQPRSFVIDQDQKTPVIVSSAIQSIEVTANKVTITLSAPAQGDKQVWVQIVGGSLGQPKTIKGRILSDSSALDISMDLGPGNYFALALVSSHLPKGANATI